MLGGETGWKTECEKHDYLSKRLKSLIVKVSHRANLTILRSR